MSNEFGITGNERQAKAFFSKTVWKGLTPPNWTPGWAF